MQRYCLICRQLTGEGLSCIDHPIVYPDGLALKPIKYQRFGEGDCHDCGTPDGGYHHRVGCDMERCPRCRGQLLTCGCMDPLDPHSHKPPIRSKVSPDVDEAVIVYWLAYYCDHVCTLCGNTGRLANYTGAATFCICPNGQGLRRGQGCS
jgi:hypothetical protein